MYTIIFYKRVFSSLLLYGLRDRLLKIYNLHLFVCSDLPLEDTGYYIYSVL